ncbi:ribonuclease R [Ligilactobacillus pobuzihii]|uniref:Ribonuclease R n=1 Tax=Ligilactobacillus pobuzihii TaxID=449659 RepID=A0A0R2L713_9LACO|nr:ribonuclease R [Ligilactobacillus pobuzihii]KRK10553.1 ribonuclease R [Ligilactobacillus pobuzihii E100301 = KCTC 13174]KRN97410.1 ribonuclease R [Ligilactobacillus pobuzihii]GEN48075.1 ribonuclease R [Ligilactobacillus pobuzihii]
MNKEKIIEKLTEFFKAEPTRKFSVEDMVQKLGMESAGQFKFVVQALTQMEHDKKVVLDNEGNFSLVQDTETEKLAGIFHANDRGYGFVTVDPEEPDYFINPTATLSALNGDEVRIEKIGDGDPSINKRPEGKIVGILNHSLTQVVGEFKSAEDENLPAGIIGTVHLKDKKLSNFRFLVEDKGLHPVPGEVILADISAYPGPALPNLLKGVAVKILGNVNDPGMDILQVVYEHDIPHEFPDDVMAQAESIPDHVTETEKEGRVDLTDQPLVTIDSIESKDLDDAVNVWKLDNGNYHLGVHIADVSHYVVPGTPLDREAFERGTSVYLTDRVIPMLPPKLSNGICSLNPHVERCAMSCEMEIDPEGNVVNHRIFPSLIKSTERMTYIAINKIVESDDQKTKERYAELVPMFEDMAELHKILLKMRKRRGAIEFDDTEAKIIVDEQGHPTDIQLRERGTSERMVESFMLAANETVAAHFHKLKVPFVYRIHESPKPEKVESFFETLGILGIEVPGKKTDIKPKMMQTILKKVAGKPEESMVSTMLLRSMQQAKYSPQPLGHFGIAATDYTHFTSPIRRYPDLMVHRLIHFYLENGTGEDAQEKYVDQLDEITTHSSDAERRGISAERDTDSMKKAEFMSDRVGEEFDAVVSSVTKFGMFISLPNTVEGLIHISQIRDDYYEYLEKQMALVGRRTKQTYRIGQPVKVKLINVNVEQKEIDFTLADPGHAPKTDLLDGVELPDRRPKRNNDHRFDHKRSQRKGNNNHRPNNKNRHSYNGSRTANYNHKSRQGASRQNFRGNKQRNKNR